MPSWSRSAWAAASWSWTSWSFAPSWSVRPGCLQLILVLLELRELVPLGVSRTTLVLVFLELRAELVPFGEGFLQLALKLLGLDARAV